MKSYFKSVCTLAGVIIFSTLTVRAQIITEYEAWQLQYFGCMSCPQAAPTADPLGDGQDNMTKFIAGMIPTNSSSLWLIQAAPTNGPVSLTVDFSDNVTNPSVTNRFWVFGDGGSGNGATPIHAYTDAGVFSVSETLFNVYGTATLIETNLVTVVPEPSTFVLAAIGLLGALMFRRRRC